MSFPQDPSERQPKGDHNRRLSLGLEREEFAAEGGVTVEALREYEMTSPDHDFDVCESARDLDADRRAKPLKSL